MQDIAPDRRPILAAAPMPAGPILVDDEIISLCSRAHSDAGHMLICSGFTNVTPEVDNALPSVPEDRPPIITHRTSMQPDVLTPNTSTVELGNRNTGIRKTPGGRVHRA